MIILLLLAIGLFARLLPHAPNFVPVVAIALFSGAYLNRKYSLLIPFALYVISDFLIGLHEVIFFNALLVHYAFCVKTSVGKIHQNTQR